jgi:hypothetical protein
LAVCGAHLDGKVGDDDAVAGVLTPRLEELAAEARLQHARRREHDARAELAVRPEPPRVAHVAELEGVALLERRAHVVVHHLDVRLVHAKRLGRYAGGLVDRDAAEGGVAGPVVVEDEEQLLRAAERDDGDEALAALPDDLPNLSAA